MRKRKRGMRKKEKEEKGVIRSENMEGKGGWKER